MTRTPFTRQALYHVACLSLIFSHCHCIFYTPYQYLPLTSFDSSNGTFGFPSGETQIFDEGTDMTIRWSTDFVAVNLYVVYNASADPPSMGIQKQLSTGYSKKTLDWTITCEPDCEAPFAIKAVDAFGDINALVKLGFWSRQFWIRPTGTTSSAQVSSSTSASTSTTTTSVPSDHPNTTPPASTTAVSISLSATTSAPLPIATSMTPTESTSMQTMAPSSATGSRTNFTAIGASVGAAAGVALMFCGAFLLWKRRKLNASHNKGVDMSSDELHSLKTLDTKIPYISHYPVFEAPGWQHTEPQELPARPV